MASVACEDTGVTDVLKVTTAHVLLSSKVKFLTHVRKEQCVLNAIAKMIVNVLFQGLYI